MRREISSFDCVVGEEREPDYECFSCRTTKPPRLTFTSRVGPPLLFAMIFVSLGTALYLEESIFESALYSLAFFILWRRSLRRRFKECSQCGSMYVPNQPDDRHTEAEKQSIRRRRGRKADFSVFDYMPY